MAEAPRTYFDPGTGDQLIGEAAIDERIIQDGLSIVPLSALLTTPDFPYDIKSFDKVDVSNMTPDDFALYGRWLSDIIIRETDDVALKREHVRRMYILGLGANEKQLMEGCAVRSFSAYKQEINIRLGHAVGLYDSWPFARFVQYTADLATVLGRKPIQEDFDAMARSDRGPSRDIAQERFGGISVLNEAVGYPDIRRWNVEDYIDWGARVMKTNRGELHWAATDILSKEKRGPSRYGVLKYFGTWQNFYDQASNEYVRRESLADRTLTEKADSYKKLISAYRLPYAFRYLDDIELVDYCDRFTLALRLFPKISDEDAYKLSCLDDDTLLEEALKRIPPVNQRNVFRIIRELGISERFALDNGVADYLKVSAEAVTAVLARIADIKQKARRSNARILDTRNEGIVA